MLRLLLIYCLIIFHNSTFSQSSDFISVKKKSGRSVKIFTAGSPIIYETTLGSYVNGWIEAIKNDSVFVKVYVIQTMMSSLGVYYRDTTNSYSIGNHYKEMRRVMLFDRTYNRKSFGMEKVEQILYIGGIGYFVLNLVNGAYFNHPVTNKENLKKLGISFGLFGSGLFLRKVIRIENDFSTRRHKIVYVSLSK